MTNDLSFTVLGPLQITQGGHTHAPRGPKISKLLALLLLRAGQLVDTDTLIDELWETDPPRHAISTIRTHIYHLRHQLKNHPGNRDDQTRQLLETRPRGYVLNAPPHTIDAAQFTTLHIQAHHQLAGNQPHQAAHTAQAALALWKGPALSNTHAGTHLTAHKRHLEEQRIQTLDIHIKAKLQLGHHQEILPQLRHLTTTHPLNEQFHTYLIQTLHRTGRRAEALTAYHQLQHTLHSELGLRPTLTQHHLQDALLAT